MHKLALDTETECATNNVPIPRLVCVSFALPQGTSGLLHWRNPKLERLLRTALENTEQLVFANAPYDLAVLGTHFPSLVPWIFLALDEGRVHDVLTRGKLLDIASGFFRAEGEKYGLDSLAMRALGRGKVSDEWKTRYGELREQPLSTWPKDAREYARNDASITLDLFDEQETHRFEWGPDVFKSERDHVYAHFALDLCSAYGIAVDHEAVEALDRGLDAELARVTALLKAEGLVRESGSKDTKKAKARIVAAYEKLGIPVPMSKGGTKPNKKTGLVSPPTPCLDALATEGSQDPILEAYSAYVSLDKMRGTFIRNLRAWDRVRPHYDELLFTGRTSASVFPIQQLPRAEGVRECLVADPGWCLISVDGNAAELVAMAQIEIEQWGDSLLGDALREGRNPHWILAANMLGLGTSREAEEEAKKHPEGKHTRQEAKKGNFGFLGGMGAAKFVTSVAREGVYISLERAAFIRQAFMDTWGLGRYLNWISGNLQHGLGNCVHASGLVRSDLRFTQMANGFFQERTAQVFKHALCMATRAAFVEGLPCRPVGFLHDELLVTCRIVDADLVGRAISNIVVESSRKFCKDVPMTAEPAAMLRLSKKAETVYDANGKLIPWEMAA